MGAFVDSVGAILSRVEKRVEVAAQNISNVSTAGYKRGVSFESVLGIQGERLPADLSAGMRVASMRTGFALDMAPAQLQATGNANDLAIAGDGFFTLKSKNGDVLFTRQGQFQRDEAGRLVNAQGCVLLQRGGGDLVLKSGDFSILNDGTVIQAGDAIGRIAIAELTDSSAVQYAENGLYTAPEATVSFMDDPSVSQGMLEASNVSMGVEMMTIMAALRQAQAGQHLMNMYDDLMGRAVTTFGQG